MRSEWSEAVFADHVKARAGDPNVALRFEDESWTYDEWVRACSARAALFDAMRADGAPHIGLLLENLPDFSMWSGAAALCGATIVGINPTRRGEGLERDINHTECQLIVTETRHLELLDGLDLGAADGRVLVIDEPAYGDTLAPYAERAAPQHEGQAVRPDLPAVHLGYHRSAESGRVLAGTPRSQSPPAWRPR